jgi:hypothetical protein
MPWHLEPVSFLVKLEVWHPADVTGVVRVAHSELAGFATSDPVWMRMFAVKLGITRGLDIRNSPPPRSIVQPPISLI